MRMPQYRPIACDVTFGALPYTSVWPPPCWGQKCIAEIEREALNISLFTNASGYSNKTYMERSMLYLTNIVVLLEYSLTLVINDMIDTNDDMVATKRIYHMINDAIPINHMIRTMT